MPIRVHKSKLLKYDDKVIKVVVGGTESRTFAVHESVVTSRSEFFKRALNGKWTEGDDGIVTLADDRADIFELYLHLVYCNEIPIEGVLDEYLSLAELYVLCEKLQDTRSKNNVVHAILEKSHERTSKGIKLFPTLEAINRIYEGTPEGNMARKLLVDMFAEHAHPTWLQGPKGRKEYPPEFLFDVTLKLLEIATLPPVRVTDDIGVSIRYAEPSKLASGDGAAKASPDTQSTIPITSSKHT